MCLFPPGNEARDLALFRRALFRAGGPPSLCALPECLILAQGLWPEGAIRKEWLREMRAEMAAAWREAVGPFRTAGLSMETGRLVLRVEGPLDVLRTRLSGLLPPSPSPILPQAKGFLILQMPAGTDPPGEGKDPAVPRLTFYAADLALLRFDCVFLSEDEACRDEASTAAKIQGLRWREYLRVPRPGRGTRKAATAETP